MGSVFITYGAKAGGGPAFLRRSRTAFGQLQTRTRTASAFNQLQTRTRTCSNISQPMVWYYGSPQCGVSQAVADVNNYQSCGYVGSQCFSANAGNSCYESWSAACGNGTVWAVYCSEPTRRDWGPFTGWSAAASCSANPWQGCWSIGNVQRECQTATVCNWSAYTAWSNVASCSPATPACTNGAFERRCQTIHTFRDQDWSAYEEVDICVSQNPTAGPGALQIECVPQ